MSKPPAGRIAEYKTARILYDRFKIITFPSPDERADLITLDGIRIEVKANNSALSWALGSSQRECDFCDFLVLWHQDETYIVPFNLDWWYRTGNKKVVPLAIVMNFKDRWDLITKEVVEQEKT